MSTIPSIRHTIFILALSRNTSLTSTRKIMLESMMIGRSKNRVFGVSIIGDMSAVTPSMRNILAILDPRTFPIAISVFPDMLAMTETMNSGILVPIATIVSPMIASDIWNFFARETAPSTRTFHPKASKTRPSMIKQNAKRISIYEKINIILY